MLFVAFCLFVLSVSNFTKKTNNQIFMKILPAVVRDVSRADP